MYPMILCELKNLIYFSAQLTTHSSILFSIFSHLLSEALAFSLTIGSAVIIGVDSVATFTSSDVTAVVLSTHV